MISVLYIDIHVLVFIRFFLIILHDAFILSTQQLLTCCFLDCCTCTANGNNIGIWIHATDCKTISIRGKIEKRNGSRRVSSLTYLAVISIFVIDSCMKTIGVHDRVFDVNDKVENSLEPAG